MEIQNLKICGRQTDFRDIEVRVVVAIQYISVLDDLRTWIIKITN